MRRLLPALFALALSLAAQAEPEIVSIGDWRCADWSARRAAPERADPPQMWLAGFMTGLATAQNIDVLAITDAPALFEWMDKFCARLPEKHVSAGGILFYEELKRRLPTTPPRLSQR